MAYEDVTPAYVNLVSYNKYAGQTADQANFDAVKQMMSVYCNSNTEALPDRKYTHGLALLICHYYAIGSLVNPEEIDDGGGGGGDLEGIRGPITKEVVGDIEVTYADLTQRNSSSGSSSGTEGGGNFDRHAWLKKSIYGLQYLRLLKSFGNRPIIV